MDSTSALSHSPGSRSLGIGLVAGLHVLAFVAISSALHYTPPKPPGDTVVKLDKTPDKPLPPVQRIEPVQPKWTVPDISRITPPDIPVSPPPVTPTVITDPTPPHAEQGGLTAVVAQVTHQSTAVQSVGAACTKTQTPELPALDWSGDAVFHVVASTEAGRVTQVEIQALRGGMDGRTQRQIKTAIERALRDGYVCPGNVRFSQEFEFRIE